MFTSTVRKLNFFHLIYRTQQMIMFLHYGLARVLELECPFNEGVCGEKRNENKLLLTTTVSSECRQVLCGTNV